MAVKLTDKEELFCNKYIASLNATQATIEAGYSEKTARQIGSKLLSKVNIQERIAELKAKRDKRLNIDQDFVVNNLLKGMRICSGVDDTHVLSSEQGSPVQLAIKKTDMANFVKIQDMFFKYIGAYEKDNEQKKNVTQITTFELPKNGRE